MQQQQNVLILDFGSQYTQLIARRVRELNIYCEIHPYNHLPANYLEFKAVILSGSPNSVRGENVSLIELVFCTKKEMSKETINEAFTIASKEQSKKVLEVTLEKLVSIDFNHNSASAIVDLSLTNVVGKNMGKISAWYDNEWGFSNRMCDIAEHLHQIS